MNGKQQTFRGPFIQMNVVKCLAVANKPIFVNKNENIFQFLFGVCIPSIYRSKEYSPLVSPDDQAR